MAADSTRDASRGAGRASAAPSSWGRSLGAGLLIGLLAAALALVFVALPLFFFASAAEPDSGTDRPFVRTGLVDIALPAAGVVGLVAGGAGVRWHRRGGRLGGVDREEEGRWGS